MKQHYCYAIVLSIALSGSVAGQGAPKTALSSIRTVKLEATSQPGMATVVVESNGPLPEPESGAPLNPPRIYLDFADVLPISVMQPESDPIVSRIRVAEHTASPLMTRVVIDLSRTVRYRIDTSARAQGRVVVIIGGPTAPSTQAPAGPAGSRGRPQAPDSQYDTRVAAALVRLHALKPLLESIDRRVETLSGDLAGAAKEFDDIANLIGGLKPPSSRATAHALLLRTCTLGARAVRLRQSSASQEVNATWDAASAAAGALLMLEKANSELMAK
jgi:hypothetical protein